MNAISNKVVNFVSDIEILQSMGTNFFTNEKENTLHGGTPGFDQRLWDAEQPDNEHLILHYTSPDGENGFPGTLDVTVRYSIENNVFRVIYEASCDQPTHVNLTQHPYFNLRPTDENIGNHELRLYTSHYLETTSDLIPTGTVLSTDKKHAFDYYDYKDFPETE